MECLNQKNEERFTDYLEKDYKGQTILGHAFFKYKQEMSTLRDTVERHINNLMSSIENGLPEVKVAINANDKTDYTFTGEGANGIQEWTCKVCQVKNEWKIKNCITCNNNRPVYKLNAAA